MQNSTEPILTIIHFNDAYDIQPQHGKGGIVNFKAKIQQLRSKHSNSLLLFSGDCFSPSILSNIKEGWQIVHCLNQIHIDLACYGNHQFDYLYQHTLKLAKSCNFQWLLGNIKFVEGKQNLGDGLDYKILQKNKRKIGVFGVAGKDWLDIIDVFSQNQLQYIDYVQHSNKMCKFLREQQKCDIIIALTHMRNDPDMHFPQLVNEVDLVLGGHDHVIMQQMINKVPVIKSGSNFRELTLIHLYQKDKNQDKTLQNLKQGRNYDFFYQLIKVQQASNDKIDKKLQTYVNQMMNQYKKFDKVVGHTQIDLQTRFNYLRAQQTPYGNLFADLFRLYLNSDVAFLNSGAIRNDCVIHSGPIKYSQISNVMNDVLVVKALTGQQIIKVLQISVQALPNTFKGSFMQVSGLKFAYNIDLSPGSRVIQVFVQGKRLDLKQIYSVTLFSYTGKGNDGFLFLKDCPTLKDQVQTISMLNLLQLFFHTINEDLIEQPLEKHQLHHKKKSAHLTRIMTLQNKIISDDSNNLLVSIKPKTTNRIIKISNTKQINLQMIWSQYFLKNQQQFSS